MTPSTLPAVIQKTISPMLSRRTTFHTFLKEIAHRHNQLNKALPAESPAKDCLAIRHPAVACEIKVSVMLQHDHSTVLKKYLTNLESSLYK